MLKNLRKGLLAQLVLLAVVACTLTLHASTINCSDTLVNPSFVFAIQLTSTTCVQSGDKLYGDFDIGSLPTGSVLQFVTTGANVHDVGFIAPFGSHQGDTFNFGYEVAVTNPLNFISQMIGNVLQSVGTSSLLITTTPAGTGPINITLTDATLSGNPFSNFTSTQNVTDLIVNNRFMVGSGSNATSVVNTLIESPVPEPSSLMLFGSGLLGLANIARRKLQKKSTIRERST